MKGYIYCFTNLINNKKYIGSTISKPNIRYNQHIYNSKEPNNPHYNYPLYTAIRKYGLENFTFEILFEKEYENEEEIRIIEKDFINKYDCISPKGYNQTDETIHPLMTPEIIEKVKITKREKAKKVAEVDKQNNIIKIWRSIVDCAEETLLDEKKIASVCRGERKTTAGRIFYWLDENNKVIIPNYIRDPYKGLKGTTQIQISSKKVGKIDLETNKIIKIYPTIALAARENNCDASGISKVCKQLRNKCGGYGWKYIEEGEECD